MLSFGEVDVLEFWFDEVRVLGRRGRRAYILRNGGKEEFELRLDSPDIQVEAF